MIIVSDTSIITNLIQVGQLKLLEMLFSTIVIPQRVHEELLRIDGRENLLSENPWIKIKGITNYTIYEELLGRIDPGEAESITLALEHEAELLLIDEKKGREVAEEYGLVITGIIGVLIDAKSENLVENVRPILDKLIFENGFRISPKLYRRVLKLVNE
ncbi:MAG: DUF3368 domain-containing protein [Bacteroidota bacterium]